MELHNFNCSGAFSAAEIDILKEPERLVRVLAGYVLMSDKESGMDTFVKRQGKRKFMTFTDDDSQEERQSRLEHTQLPYNLPLPVELVTYYSHTIDGKYVVKFS